MASVEGNMCSCRVCACVRFKIDQIFRVLDIYGWMLDAYIVDFYEENFWNKLPSGWRSFLDNITPEELGVWILRESPCKRVWPLSLLSLRQTANILEIHRNEESEGNLECQKNVKTDEIVNSYTRLNEGRQNDDKNENVYTFSTHPKLKNLFAKHVKPKKRHEIAKMAEIAEDCAKMAHCECVVDVGAGMGHLARMLAYKYGFCVTCIEQQPLLSERARKWDNQLEVTASKYLSNFCAKKPRHMSAKIEASDCSKTGLVDQLIQQFESNFNLAPGNPGFGLIGLHPCGNLAATLLKFYYEQDEAKFICIAGCCYMKLTLEDETENPKGYPLSEYLRSFEKNRLSYTALEVACHAVENYCDKLKAGKYHDLKVHAYRAALESMLIQNNCKLRHIQVKNVKLKEDTTFQQYCIAATEDFEPEHQPIIPEDFEDPRIANFLSRWRQVVTFGTLRLMLAPLAETIVLLDRFLFLSEKNLAPRLRPVFDPRLSPRNFVLTSIKRRY